jgi:hypothetical protein
MDTATATACPPAVSVGEVVDALTACGATGLLSLFDGEDRDAIVTVHKLPTTLLLMTSPPPPAHETAQ